MLLAFFFIMMKDSDNRIIDYLRISVIDRCNQRCKYCMPEGGVDLIDRKEILSYEEILTFVRVAVGSGIRKIRITGGEPLLRRDIVGFIEQLASIEGIEDLSLTTNGVLLAEMAEDMRRAGLKRINISLDSLNPQKYRRITRGGDLRQVKEGISRAIDAGFTPVKINVVGIRGFNDDELADMAAMTINEPIHVRFIEFMPVGERFFWTHERHLPIPEIKDLIKERYRLIRQEETIGSGPAEGFSIEGAKGVIGFISPISSRFCARCNRLRLTADGHLRACLFSDQEVDVKSSLRCGAHECEIQERIKRVILQKPSSCDIAETLSTSRFMPSIGG